MKKVAIYVDSLLRNGAQRVTITLANYLVNNGYTCTIITGSKNKNEFDVPNNVERVDMNFEEKKYIKYLFNIRKLKKYLEKKNFDVIIGMDIASSLYVIPASNKLKIKTIISERNDPTHFPGKKIVANVSRKLMKNADGYVFQTEDAKKFYKSITKGKGVIIANPLYLENLPRTFKGKRNKTIVSAGRLTEQKNYDMLIDAFNIVHKSKPDYKLIIYGDGELRKKLEEKIKKLKLEKYISLPGNISNVLEKINNSSLFVLSSHYEGMPNILIEALAIGLPCISTNCPIGGPKSLIKNKVNGILTKNDDINDMANNILFVLNNENLANEMSTEAMKIRKKLDSKKICAKWVEYINEV